MRLHQVQEMTNVAPPTKNQWMYEQTQEQLNYYTPALAVYTGLEM